MPPLNGIMLLLQGEVGFDLRSMIGVPELIVMCLVAIFWLVLIATGIWVIVTLQRLRTGQQAIKLKLEMLERLLQRSSEH